MLDGFLFSATMGLSTPLRALRQHGMHAKVVKPDMQPKTTAEGIWMPALDGQRGFYGTMSSDVGPIPANGGDFLRFLTAAREAVEVDGGIQARIALLRSVLRSPEWRKFVGKLGGQQAIIDLFFPKFLDTIPGLPQASREALWEKRLDTPAKLAAAPDDRLLAIKGVGAAKLAAIRAACSAAQAPDSDRLDMVQR